MGKTGRRSACRGRRFRARRAAARQSGRGHPAGARLPHRSRPELSRPGPAAAAWLSRLLRLAAAGLRRPCRGPHGQARQSRMAAGQGAGALGRLFPRSRPRPPAPHLPLHRQRPGRGQPGQAPQRRGDRRPSDAALDPRRILRAARRARAAGRRVLRRGRGRPAPHRLPARRDPGPEPAPRPRPRRRHRTGRGLGFGARQARQPPLRAQGAADPGRPARVRPGARRRPSDRSPGGTRPGTAQHGNRRRCLAPARAGCGSGAGRLRPARLHAGRPLGGGETPPA